MALRPDTPETRMVPVAGRQFAERRLIRGVGAKERAVGYAWGRMTSRQRQFYGNQRNFAGSMQEVANQRAAKAQEAHEEEMRNKGRQQANAANGAPPAQDEVPIKRYQAPGAVNHAAAVLQTPMAKRLASARLRGSVRMSDSGDDY